jgi:large subunit ribosomal protein L30
MAIKLRVTQLKSGINRPEGHKLALKGLGLTRMHKTVILNDTPAIRGMIRKVSHLVRVEPADHAE